MFGAITKTIPTTDEVCADVFNGEPSLGPLAVKVITLSQAISTNTT